MQNESITSKTSLSEFCVIYLCAVNYKMLN